MKPLMSFSSKRSHNRRFPTVGRADHFRSSTVYFGRSFIIKAV